MWRIRWTNGTFAIPKKSRKLCLCFYQCFGELGYYKGRLDGFQENLSLLGCSGFCCAFY